MGLPTFQVVSSLDMSPLLVDIKTVVASDLIYAKCLESKKDPNDPQWLVGDSRFLLHNGQIFVPESKDLHLQILRARHDHQLAGHMGQSKTYQMVCHDYSWPKIHEFIRDYIKTCSTCMCNKSRKHQPYGLLKQLPIPPQPWEFISMNFIEQLPESLGYTNILVVVGRLTKQAIFIPTQRSINTVRLMEIFV